MLEDIHDETFVNDEDTPQFDEFLDVSQTYNNYIPITEYHNNYEEFPTVYYENAYEDNEEKDERKRRNESLEKETSGFSNSRRENSRSAARASASVVAVSSSTAVTRVTATSAIAATFIALVAVVGFVIPTIENTELGVDVNTNFDGDTLTYSIFLTNMSEDSDYYATVLEGDSVVYQKKITESHVTDTVRGLNLKMDHRVEVRIGLIPIDTVKAAVIPGAPVDDIHITTSLNSIDYDVNVASTGRTLSLEIYEEESQSRVYSKVLQEGLNKDSVTGLLYKHNYSVKILVNGEESVSRSVATGKMNPEITAPVARTGLVYTGDPQNLVDPGTNVTPGSFLYSATEAGTYSTSIPTGTNTGIYSVWYKFVPDDADNYNTIEATLVSDSITIGKPYPRITAPTAKEDLGYTGFVQDLINAGTPITPGEFTYSTTETGTYTSSIPTGTEMGIYSVWYKFTPDDLENYTPIGATLVSDSITISKGTQNPPAQSIDFTYGESKSVSVTGLVESPALSYAVQSGSSVIVDETGVLTWVSGGDSVIRVAFTETEHYKAGYIDVTISAIKAAQNPSASSIDFTYGESKTVSVTGLLESFTMSYAVQSGGSVSVNPSSGALTWLSKGESVIRASYTETTHYKAGYIDVDVSTFKTTQNPSADPVTVPYEGVAYITVTGLGDAPALTYDVTEGTSVTVDGTGKLTWVSVGEAKVKVSFAETDHYLAGDIEVAVTAKESYLELKVATKAGDQAIAVANIRNGYTKSTTIGLYSDMGCTTPVTTPESVTETPTVYNYTIPGSGNYYIGVWGSDGGSDKELLGRSTVTKQLDDPFRVSGQYLSYKVDLGELEGTVSIKKGSTVVHTDSESPYEGNITDWNYKNDYTLTVTVLGTEITIKTLELTNAISDFTAKVYRQDVEYEATSVSYPITIYICDGTGTVVGYSYITSQKKGTITATVNLGTTYHAYANKAGLEYGDPSVDALKEVVVDVSADFVEFDKIGNNPYEVNLYFNYDWKGQTSWGEKINFFARDLDHGNVIVTDSNFVTENFHRGIINLDKDGLGGSHNMLCYTYYDEDGLDTKNFRIEVYSGEFTSGSEPSGTLLGSTTITIP